MTLAEMVGARFLIGMPGTALTPEIVRHFKELHAGGVIFYRINFVSPEQIRGLITGLEEALGRKLLVAVDHEGGRVIMFREGITVFPDNLALGQTGKVEYARQQGEIEARELRRLGVDVNLGPVLDVLTQAYSPNIGIRSYGLDWRTVAALGTARLTAMQAQGLSACAKHFPGKGHAPVDAHLGLPVIPSTWEEMEAVHLKPFRAAVAAGVDLVMSSHPYYPNLDPTPGLIATFSRRIVHDYLRGELNFQGVIASDDLEMGAVKAVCPVGEAAVRAAAAGHDLLLVCHDPGAQKEAYYRLLEAYQTGELPRRELEASVARLEALKAKRPQRFAPGEPRPEPAGAPLAQKIAREAVRVVQDPQGLLPLTGRQLRLTVIFPRFAALADKIMIEAEVMPEEEFVRREFGRFGFTPAVAVVPIDTPEEDIQGVTRQAAASDLTILFVYDAHLFPGQKQLLEAVQRAAPRLIVALLRDPYDAAFIRPEAACLTAFGWRVCQLRAVMEKMAGEG
uniref:Beta-N-acetylhexosaminidase n=1 Tax=Desulfobacca acetoxidans TaxID=60893 RepID=A0A7V4G9B2_9BACT